MIIRGRWHDTAYTLSLKADSLSVAINVDTVIVHDRAGRFYSLYQEGHHHRRSLNGQMLQKWPGADGRQRRWLEHTAADQLIDTAAHHLRRLLGALPAPDWQWLTPPDHPTQLRDVISALERGARFDSAVARLDAARFANVFSPIGILPPDQYLALVLQATEGCSFNTCTFCDLYHQAFRVKTPDEFRQHIRQVREYLGDSILLRQRSIFLGAANTLAIPMARLTPMLEIIQEEFAAPDGLPNPSVSSGFDNPSGATPKVYAFLDAFTGTRKSVEDYRVLAGLGLKRVYIGLESGHDPLLQFVKKPGQAADAIETVRAIKAAGINVGVIVLIGLGGDRFVDGHTRDTVAVLNQMSLGNGDLIYFSDLVEEAGTPYPQIAAQHGLRALSANESAEQRAAIRSGLNLNGAKVSNYDVREFVY
ncbi:MAG: radical SAM protein [Chloroflexi bacterium]|nr:radical SAM protein [Chloroflexota bacterium]